MYDDPYENDGYVTPPPVQYWSYEELEPPRTTFPVSSARDEPYLPMPQGKRYDPLRILEEPEEGTKEPAVAPSTDYDYQIMQVYEVAPGVLSDNTLTVNHPAVRDFLACAEEDPECPLPIYPNIFALAALAVYYHPTKRSHWLFWNKAKREETARIVQKVLNAKPDAIRSPVAWMGVSENLGIVGNIQSAWREQLSTDPWFARFFEPKSFLSKSSMNLRKRKPPLLPQENATNDADTPPPKKRPRTRKIKSAVDAQYSRSSQDQDAGGVETRSKSSNRRTGSLDVSSTPSTRDSTIPLDGEIVPVRKSRRQKEQQAKGLSPESESLAATLRNRSSSMAESTSEGSTAVSICSMGSIDSMASMTTIVEVDDDKGMEKIIDVVEEVDVVKAKDKKKKLEQGIEPPTLTCPSRSTRASVRIASGKSAKEKKDLMEQAPGATGKVAGSKKSRRVAAAPYPKDKEDQTASGRGKGVNAKKAPRKSRAR